MARKPSGKPNGSPKKTLDDQQWAYLLNLIKIQCTEAEIASHFNMDIKTMIRICEDRSGESFSVFYPRYKVQGHSSLRRNLFRLSEKNPAVAIHLSKNMLGMAEKIEAKLDAKVDAEITYVSEWGTLKAPPKDPQDEPKD